MAPGTVFLIGMVAKQPIWIINLLLSAVIFGVLFFFSVSFSILACRHYDRVTETKYRKAENANASDGFLTGTIINMVIVLLLFLVPMELFSGWHEGKSGESRPEFYDVIEWEAGDISPNGGSLLGIKEGGKTKVYASAVVYENEDYYFLCPIVMADDGKAAVDSDMRILKEKKDLLVRHNVKLEERYQ